MSAKHTAREYLDLLGDVERLRDMVDHLIHTILDRCCTCGAGTNDLDEHARDCVAAQMIEPRKNT